MRRCTRAAAVHARAAPVAAAAVPRRCASSVDPAEIDRFRKLASRWWDVSGPMQQLHYMNPARMGWVARTIANELNRGHRDTATPLKGLRVLDVGCGGGIATEALGNMGAEVLGVDANEAAIEVGMGRLNGESQHLAELVSYRNCLAEDLLAEGVERFDAVVALEIVEHVNHPKQFVKSLSALLRPGGVVCMSTINKNLLSWGLGIVLAEHLLKAVPVGTHEYEKFIRPEELSAYMTAANLLVTDIKGLTPVPDVASASPLPGASKLDLPCPTYNWAVTENTAVNYLMSGIRYTEPAYCTLSKGA